MFEILSDYFLAPEYLALLAVVIIGIFVFIGTNKRLYFARVLILLCLVLALAEPYSPVSLFGGGSSKLIILDDNSSSYDIYEEGLGASVNDRLQTIGPEYKLFGEKYVSDIGDVMIDSLQGGKNILLLSDGNVNHGKSLAKVRETALLENLSISLIKQEAKEADYSIELVGPEKVGPDTETAFSVVVHGTDATPKNVQLFVDGQEVLSGEAGVLEYKKTFKEGYHKLTARITDSDFFPENNIYYHTLKVVEKPKILLFGQEGTPLHQALQELYDIDVGSLIGLDKYHAVVIDNMPVEQFSDKIDELQTFVEDGNGLIVFGGKNAFEYGNYEGSDFEHLLPVKIAGTGKKEGNLNVVILIDISGSVGSQYGLGTTADVAKSLAVSVMQSINQQHSVGIIAFNDEGYVIEPLGPLEEKDLVALQFAISSLIPSGATNIGNGIAAAVDMLKGKAGGKNVILITDGNTQGSTDESICYAEKNGVIIYTIGIGEDPNEMLLKKIANGFETEQGSCPIGGAYYRATQAHQLNIIFGDPDKASGAQSQVKIEDYSHFITENLFVTPSVYGINEVSPKDSAQLLISSGKGYPVLTVWRVGLGRVAVVSTDSGLQWSGDFYKGGNSKIISRTINWGAGDPERKNPYFFSVNDPRVAEEFEITVKSETAPDVADYQFEKKSDGTYVALDYAEKAGFFEFGDDAYAVNYNSEYEKLGINKELEDIVSSTGGRVFGQHENLDAIEKFIKEDKNLLKVEKELFVWPLIALAMAIFILDVWFRTIQERKDI